MSTRPVSLIASGSIPEGLPLAKRALLCQDQHPRRILVTGKAAQTLEPFDINSEAGQTRLLQMHRNSEVCSCVNGVTHDVNNLLGAAMAYAELVAFDDAISEDSKRMLRQIVDGITKCSYLVSSLTSIARKEHSEINIVSPQQLMDEVLVLRDYEFKRRQIIVERDYQPDAGAVTVDMPKLKMALIFLLINAQEATENMAQKTVRVAVTDRDGGICFDIWDSGSGLKPEQAKTVFDAFQTSDLDGNHMGLGLFSARKIAELHGGSLTYTPKRGFSLFIKRDHDHLKLAT